MISYILGPNPTTQFTDNSGLWVNAGFLVTKDWDTRLPKATYYDPDGLVLRPNPLPLDSVGRQYQASQPIYWADDAPYYLQLLDSDLNQIWESAYPYYPGSSSHSTTNSGNDATNLFINGQMRFFPTASHSPIPSSIPIVAEGGWSYAKDGTNTTTTLSFEKYLPDNIDVDASPTYFLHNVSTSAGTGETVNTLSFTLQDVRTLAGEQITVSWNVRSLLAGSYTLSVNAVQHFGTGGSPSANVTTNVMIINPTTSAENYSGTITLPTLSGKTIGTNGDDSLIITFTFPLNTNYNIQTTNFYMKRGVQIANYPYISYAETRALLIPTLVPLTTATTAGAFSFSTTDTLFPLANATYISGSTFTAPISQFYTGYFFYAVSVTTSTPIDVYFTIKINGGDYSINTHRIDQTGTAYFSSPIAIFLGAGQQLTCYIRESAASLGQASMNYCSIGTQSISLN